METFKITIKDNFFDEHLTGEFDAVNEDQAKSDAKEYYAHELDTTPEHIEIISCNKI